MFYKLDKKLNDENNQGTRVRMDYFPLFSTHSLQ